VVGLIRGGAWPQLAAVPTNRLATIPDRVSDAQAATLPTAGMTALLALEAAGPVLAKRVLITGATGGVGRMATQLAADDETVTFRATRFERAFGARIYTLNLFDELASRPSATSDLTRLCGLIVDGRLDGQVQLEDSWHRTVPAIEALLHRRIGGKAVLHID